jgi:hypothetical protein
MAKGKSKKGKGAAARTPTRNHPGSRRSGAAGRLSPAPAPARTYSAQDASDLLKKNPSGTKPYLEALMNESYIKVANTPQLTHSLVQAELLGSLQPQNVKELRKYASFAIAGFVAKNPPNNNPPDDELHGSDDSASDNDPSSGEDSETTTARTPRKTTKGGKPPGRDSKKRPHHADSSSDDSADDSDVNTTKTKKKTNKSKKRKRIYVTIGGVAIPADDDSVTITDMSTISGTDWCTIRSDTHHESIKCKVDDLYCSPFQYAHTAWSQNSDKVSPGKSNTYQLSTRTNASASPIAAALTNFSNSKANTNDANSLIEEMSQEDRATLMQYSQPLLDEIWNRTATMSVTSFRQRGKPNTSQVDAVNNFFTLLIMLHPNQGINNYEYQRKLQQGNIDIQIICDIIDFTRSTTARSPHMFATNHSDALQAATLKAVQRNAKAKKVGPPPRGQRDNNNNNSNGNNNSNNNNNSGNSAGGNGGATGGTNQFTAAEMATFKECQQTRACYVWNTRDGADSCSKGAQHPVGGQRNSATIIHHRCGRCGDDKHKITKCTKKPNDITSSSASSAASA